MKILIVADELKTAAYLRKGLAEVGFIVDVAQNGADGLISTTGGDYDLIILLFLARAENPQQQIARARLDARREIEAVREFFDALTESRGVKVAIEGQCGIDADPILFRRAMTNLLSNALRHTPRGGKIVLSVDETDDDAVLVAVSDSGCGIRPEHLPRICDRLYRADQTDRQVSGQSGLGLSIVKSIVELHGGSIAIDSALGNGTTVRMRFPASPSAAA